MEGTLPDRGAVAPCQDSGRPPASGAKLGPEDALRIEAAIWRRRAFESREAAMRAQVDLKRAELAMILDRLPALVADVLAAGRQIEDLARALGIDPARSFEIDADGVVLYLDPVPPPASPPAGKA